MTVVTKKRYHLVLGFRVCHFKTKTSTMTALPLTMTCLLLLMGDVQRADAHGALTQPQARNWRANQFVDGIGPWACSSTRNDQPLVDYNWNALNENESTLGSGVATSACGITQRDSGDTFDYSRPTNCNGDPLPFASQASYAPGQEFEVDVQLTAHHEGFFEFFVCPDTMSPTRACFETYPLEFVSDPLYGALKDPSFPTRAYIPPSAFYDGSTHKYVVKMPNNAPSGNVLLQWRYTTGNTCELNSGYLEFYNSLWGGAATSVYGSLPACGISAAYAELPDTREDFQKVPERFWNCAEISITGGGGSPNPPATPPPTSKEPSEAPSSSPTKKPTTPPPSTPPPTTVSPTPVPSATPSSIPTAKPTTKEPTPQPSPAPSLRGSTTPSASPTDLIEVTCGNDICEAHEIGNIDSCITTTLCPQDCTIMEDDPVCGDGICHGGNGENSNTCSQDCPGRTKGRKQDRCYCGFHYDYNDDRYGADQSLCTMEQVSGTTSCCGDGVCAGSETAVNCPSDC